MSTDAATTDGQTTNTDPNAAAAAAAGGAAAGAAAGGQQGDQKTDAVDTTKRTARDDNGKEWTADEAVAEMRRLRAADAERRVSRKGMADTLRDLAKAAGVEGVLADEAPTVEGLARDLQAKTVDMERASERATKAESDLAVIRAAWAAGISPEREGYLSFLMSSDTEVTAARGTDQFGATVSSKIAALAGSDPMLKGTAGSGGKASGPDSFGGANGSSAITPEAFEAMSYDERLDLFQKNPEEYRRLSAG